ncbi:MAG: hypothetical protein JWN40_1863 [Phycisphaerales bacterium]|nr:hypothetical protein [Phycisphaerales bacterium]
MTQPTARPHVALRASHREATLTAGQWFCCMSAAAIAPLAWQQGLYQLAYQRAVESVHAEQLSRHEPSWN